MAHVNDKQVAPDAFGYDILQQSRLRYEHGNGVALLMPKCSVSGGRRFAFFAGPVPTCKGNSLVQQFGNVIFPIKLRQTYAHQFRIRVCSFDPFVDDRIFVLFDHIVHSLRFGCLLVRPTSRESSFDFVD